jgi:serine protease Do
MNFAEQRPPVHRLSHGRVRSQPTATPPALSRRASISAWFAAAAAVCAMAEPVASQEFTGIEAARAMQDVLVQAIERGERSVAAIARARRGDQSGRLLDPDYVPSEYATGVVVDKGGLILTNYHVLGHPDRNDFAVWIARRPYLARIKAADPWTDLAVLQIDADDLPPIRFGDAKQLRKGHIVIALGNPYAIARDGSVSATWGIVSNLGRAATVPGRSDVENDRDTVHHFGTLIQTDARLQKGTSGGALLNLRGEMVGLTTSIAALPGYEKSAGFAIPIDEATQRAIKELKQGRQPEYGFLGVGPEVLSVSDRQEGKFGVRLVQVVEGTPAARDGLEPGDVIMRINGVPIHDEAGLIREVSLLPAGADARFSISRFDTLLRRRRSLTREIALAKKYVEGTCPGVSTVLPPSWRGLQVDFSTAIPDFHRYADQADPRGCVAVTHVEKDAPAWESGLRSGLFLSHVDGQRVSTPRDFLAAVDGRTDAVTLTLTTDAVDGSNEVTIDHDR